MENIKDLQKTFQKRNFYSIKDASNVFFYAVIFPIAFGLLFSYIAILIADAFIVIPEGVEKLVYLFQNFEWFSIPYTLLSEVVFCCIFFCYHKINRISFNATKLNVKKINWFYILLVAGLGIFCVLGFICLIEGCFGHLFEITGIYDVKNPPISLSINTVGWYFTDIIVLGIIPAVVEEIIFRGIIFQGLREKYSVGVSVIFCGVLFALIHQNIMQFIYPFILGCVLSLLMEKTGNLIYPIVLHLFNNLTTITVSFLTEIHAISLEFPMVWWFILLSIALAVISSVVIFLIFKFIKFKKTDFNKEGELIQTPAISIKNVPVLLICGIIFTLIFIVINAI